MDVTRRLIEGYSGASSRAMRRREAAVAGAVARLGSREDAEALLPVFLEDPGGRAALLPVLGCQGDDSVAERLLAATVADGELRDGVPSGVLRVLGYLGHEAAEHVLWNHAIEVGGYGEAMDATLGLANLSCAGLVDQIDAALEVHFGANVFPEFLPVLAVKTGDPSWLGRLAAWGDGGASTDCNGGLVLGIALFGAVARAEYTRVLWDPWWEADGNGTGTSRWAYTGACALGIGMAELYGELVERLDAAADEKARRHCLSVFKALLWHWVERPWPGLRMAPEPKEPAGDLAALLFDWSTPHEDDSLTGRAARVLGHDSGLLREIYELEHLLAARVRYEALLEAGGIAP